MEKREKRDGWGLFYMIIIVGIFVLGVMVLPRSETKDELRGEIKRLKAEIAALKKVQTTAIELNEVFLNEPEIEAAGVQEREGIENCISRQLLTRIVDDPSQELILISEEGEIDVSYRGDLNDVRAMRKWAGKLSRVIATLTGYVDFRTGNEIRIKTPGAVAYVLVIEDDILKGIRECPADKCGLFQTASETARFQKIARSFGDAKLKNPNPAYEYLLSRK